jgi:hypothetical protein
VLAHPALDSRFKLMQEGRKLASQKSVGAEGDSKVFEREATFIKTRFLKDILLQVVTDTTKIYKGFPGVNMQH